MLSRLLFHVRTALVLTVLVLLVVLGATWGWRQMTKPFPAKAQASVCVDTPVKAGEKIFPAQVVVNVYNGSDREGLASRTISALTDAGFVPGKSGNAPAKLRVKTSQIWTTDPKNPAVQLVASWLHKPTVIHHRMKDLGVVVVVGQDFGQVAGGRKFVVAGADGSICSPPLD